MLRPGNTGNMAAEGRIGGGVLRTPDVRRDARASLNLAKEDRWTAPRTRIQTLPSSAAVFQPLPSPFSPFCIAALLFRLIPSFVPTLFLTLSYSPSCFLPLLPSFSIFFHLSLLLSFVRPPFSSFSLPSLFPMYRRRDSTLENWTRVASSSSGKTEPRLPRRLPPTLARTPSNDSPQRHTLFIPVLYINTFHVYESKRKLPNRLTHYVYTPKIYFLRFENQHNALVFLYLRSRYTTVAIFFPTSNFPLFIQIWLIIEFLIKPIKKLISQKRKLIQENSGIYYIFD